MSCTSFLSALWSFWVDTLGNILFYGTETLHMTFEGLREMCEGDTADKFLLIWMGGPSDQVSAGMNTEGKTPIGVNGHLLDCKIIRPYIIFLGWE